MLPLYKNQGRQNPHTHVHACFAVKYDLSLNDVSINYLCKYTLSLNDAQKSGGKKQILPSEKDFCYIHSSTF